MWSLQSSVSHDSSEIILIVQFDAQDKIITINVENSCVLGKPWYIWWIESSKEQHLFEI